MSKTSIALFHHRPEAEQLQKRLADAGIPAVVHECTKFNGARIDVPTDEFENAHASLVAWDAAEHVLHDAIRCPECGAFRVDYPQYTNKSSLPNLLIGLLANIGAMRKEFFCHDCHFTWPKEGTKPSRKRPHMAPYYFIEGIPQQPPAEEHAA